MYKRWPKNYEISVFFTAIYTPGLKELVTKLGNSSTKTSSSSSSTAVNSTVMEEEEEAVKLKPNWRARLVWTGLRPTEEKIMADEDQAREELQKAKKNETDDFLAAISGTECIHGQLDRILTNNCGVLLSSSGQKILFSVDNFTVDGERLKAEDSLRKFLEEGDQLYCYARIDETPFLLEGCEITGRAVQVWKGRPVEGLPEESSSLVSKKASIPPPCDATHLNMVGSVVELATPGIGYLEISAGDLRGERVLFSRNRMCINGNKLKFRGSLADHLAIGDQVCFDMVRAAESKREPGARYEWIALLAWIGSDPNRTEINEEVCRKIENYRAKVIALDDWSKETGCTGGILQVTAGSSRIGERAVFGRENTHVFGVRLNRADLSYILRVGDKVQIELQSLPQPLVRCAVEIRYRASLVYIGPSPKLEDLAPEDPSHQLSSSVTPFLVKRGLTEQEFLSLVRGQLPPRAPPLGGSPTCRGGVGQDPAAPVVLPPSTIYGRVIELRKPENPASGTEHGLFQIENGPFQQERAFFNRNCLFCWGYNCAKADLMYLITESDRFCVEIQVVSSFQMLK